MNTIRLIEKMTSANAIGGFETNLKREVLSDLEKLVDEVRYDDLGGVNYVINGTKPGAKIAIITHMDEVGFMVKEIRENGLIKLIEIGSLAISSIVSQRIELVTSENKVFSGLIHGIPPHFNNEQKTITIGDLFADFGFSSKEEAAQKGVKVGDMVVLKQEFTVLENQRIASKALDNRLGCVLNYQLLEYFSENRDFKGQINFCFSVQEELGLRGAGPIIHTLDDDLKNILVVDVSPIDDLKEESKNGNLGAGTLLRVSDPATVFDQREIQKLRKLADNKEIPWQNYFSFGRTDSTVAQITKSGYLVVALCVPARNVHTNSTLVDLKDYEATKSLSQEYIQAIINEE